MYQTSSYTMICLTVRGENQQALAHGLSLIQVDKYFALPLSLKTLKITKLFLSGMVEVPLNKFNIFQIT